MPLKVPAADMVLTRAMALANSRFAYSAPVTSTNTILNQSVVDDPDIFKCFPKFPIEIRLQIWSEALPSEEDRTLRLFYDKAATESNPERSLHFRVPTKNEQHKGQKKKSRKNKSRVDCYFVNGEPVPSFIMLRLSSTCKESRKVYLKEFKNNLLSKEGSIRFDDNTRVYIYNFWLLSLRQADFNSVEVQHRIPTLYRSIKRLCIPVDSIWLSSSARRGWELNDNSPLFRMFSNLEVLDIDTSIYASYESLASSIATGDDLFPTRKEKDLGAAARLEYKLQNYEMTYREYKAPKVTVSDVLVDKTYVQV